MCNYQARWAGRHEGARHGWGHRFGSFKDRFEQAAGGPPVNIRETREGFEILLAAPGRSKEDFRLSVTDDVLTIASERPESGTGDSRQWLRHEYRLAPFERRFQLSSKVDADLIVARYADGVLEVTLPKKPEFSGPAQEIAVA